VKRNNTLRPAILAYSAEFGVSERTAQWACQNNKPKWQEFYLRFSGQYTGKAVETALAVPEKKTTEKFAAVDPQSLGLAAVYFPKCIPPSALQKAESERLPQEQLVVEMWTLVNQIIGEVRQHDEPLVRLGGLEKLAKGISAYSSCEREVLRVLQAARSLVPVSELAFIEVLLSRVSDIVYSILDLAGQFPSEIQPFARGVLGAFLTDRFEPAVHTVRETVDGIMASAGVKVIKLQDTTEPSAAAA
jgi:hypothetical protein